MLPVQSLEDPRIAAYRNLRDRTLRGESIFVTEGEIVTRRLLESSLEAESVLVAEEFVAEYRRLVPETVPLYVAPKSLLSEIVGFHFHLGVLGLGRRPAPPALDELLAGKTSGPLKLVVCPEITKPENMGLVFRSVGGFGIDAILLGERCCDPLARRCLRTSMGASLFVPYRKSADLRRDLMELKQRFGVELLAAVLDAQAEPLSTLHWPARTGLLVGNEYYGLAEDWLSLADRRVTIPMKPNTDSLNLGVAAGIFFYEMTRRGA